MSKSRFNKGSCIESVDEMLQQDFVYFYDKMLHKGFFENWSLKFIKKRIDAKSLFYAHKRQSLTKEVVERLTDSILEILLREVHLFNSDIDNGYFTTDKWKEFCLHIPTSPTLFPKNTFIVFLGCFKENGERYYEVQIKMISDECTEGYMCKTFSGYDRDSLTTAIKNLIYHYGKMFYDEV